MQYMIKKSLFCARGRYIESKPQLRITRSVSKQQVQSGAHQTIPVTFVLCNCSVWTFRLYSCDGELHSAAKYQAENDLVESGISFDFMYFNKCIWSFRYSKLSIVRIFWTSVFVVELLISHQHHVITIDTSLLIVCIT